MTISAGLITPQLFIFGYNMCSIEKFIKLALIFVAIFV
jgi:hypothetical protein